VIDLLEPADIGEKLLVWLGLPSVVVGVITLLLALLAWWDFLKKRTQDVRAARENLRQWTSFRQRATARLVAAGAGFVAVAYSLSQLAGVTYERVSGQRSIAEGQRFDSSYLFVQLIGYQHWTRLSTWTVLAALVSVFLLNVANLIGSSRLRSLITTLWGLVLLPAVIAGFLMVLAGVCVLILGLTRRDAYQPSMTWLYAIWAACLFALPWLGMVVKVSSAEAFKSDSA
jgi:hypothetical protein